ncbi:MAG: hypothetical protein O2780_14360 [Proteobacteria bacterium]|jgi:hypothetical protein|nr:hypothetical protein [Pseudomonadota bacterium]MDA1299796.1 hypothetical protein [Pseudomonadota bacterium]
MIQRINPTTEARKRVTRVRQQVMVLYLSSSALDSGVVGWAFYDGTGNQRHAPGAQDEPPYRTGLGAMEDGWRLIQASPLVSHIAGQEFRTDYLKYEFFFEKLVQYG